MIVTGNGYTDANFIAFGSDFTDNFDYGFDGNKLMSRAGQPSIYVTEGTDNYAVYAVPPFSSQVKDIPVAFVPGAAGSYTLNMGLNTL